MKRKPVTSSGISSVGYDESSKILEIEFIDGDVYQYFDVPRRDYDGLMGANSIGRYVNQDIKPNYRFSKV